MDSLGEEEYDEDSREATEGRLKPEDDTPGPICDYYAADKRAKGRTDQSSAEKPSHSSCSSCG